MPLIFGHVTEDDVNLTIPVSIVANIEGNIQTSFVPKTFSFILCCALFDVIDIAT